MPVARPVILSGGSGTRLWPLSTPDLPKQFAPLLPGGSLFVQTLLRMEGVVGMTAPVIVTGGAYANTARAMASDVGVPPEMMIVEPVGRNTAPAVLAAAMSVDTEDVLMILPSDHLVENVVGFASAVTDAVEKAVSGSIVTFGITPTSPETGYGYIEMGRASGNSYQVNRFKEKPETTEAVALVSDGRHVWNSGIFVVVAGTLIEEALVHCPELVSGVRASLRPADDGVLCLGDEFLAVESISLDHAIMEKTKKAVVMPIDVGWSDVGSYEALYELSEKDEAGNAVSGDVLLRDVSGSLIRATSRRVAVAGLSEVVVIETAEAVLVLPKDRAQEAGEMATEIGSAQSPPPL